MLFKQARRRNAHSVDLAIPKACYGPEFGVELCQKVMETSSLFDVIVNATSVKKKSDDEVADDEKISHYYK